MKKTYIQPTTEIIKVVGQHMLANSTLDTGTTPTDPASSDVHIDNSWDIWGSGDDFDEDF